MHVSHLLEIRGSPTSPLSSLGNPLPRSVLLSMGLPEIAAERWQALALEARAKLGQTTDAQAKQLKL